MEKNNLYKWVTGVISYNYNLFKLSYGPLLMTGRGPTCALSQKQELWGEKSMVCNVMENFTQMRIYGSPAKSSGDIPMQLNELMVCLRRLGNLAKYTEIMANPVITPKCIF